MPEYIVGEDQVTPVTPETWLIRYWLSGRTLRGGDTGLSRVEAEEYLRGQALGNSSAAIRRRCWLALEWHGVDRVRPEADRDLDENRRG